MTRRLSLITAVGVAALSVSVPTAFGSVHANAEVAPALAQPDPMHENGFAQAVAAKRALESNVGTYRDAYERGSATNLVQSNVREYRDSFERAAIHNQLTRQSTPLATNSNVSNYRDSFERTDLSPESAPTVSVTTSGRDIEWPQIGVGFGIGLLLALGLGLTMRAVHSRPFAH